MKRVGIPVRIAAAAIDGVVFLIFFVIGAIVIAVTNKQAVGTLIMLVLWLLYSAMEVIFAGTPGKLLLGLRIARQDGRRAERSRLWLRWSTKYYSLLPSLFDCFIPGTAITILGGYGNTIILCGLLGALNEDGLTWHDGWSGTAVWKTSAPPPLPPTLGSAICTP